jgi:hypothetical protein
MAGESSVVNVLVGEGLANVQAVAKANLRQPRYAVRVRTNDRGSVDVEPLQRRRRSKWWGKQQSYAPCRSTGVLGMACTDKLATQIGDPLAAKDVVWTKQIRRTAVASGSDVAIVSIDLAGQHNRLASQGPLDGRVWGWKAVSATGGLVHLDHRSSANTLATRISRAESRRRSCRTACLKPYWGKPAVRNFRGERENTMPPVRLADA